MKYDNETILKKHLERIDREVTGFKGVIDMWDVINAVVIMPIFDKYDNAGVPISAIVIQSHQHQGYWGKEKLEEVLDRHHHHNRLRRLRCSRRLQG